MKTIVKRFSDQGRIATALRELRIKADLLQKEVAEALDIPRVRYNRAEVGEVRLTLDQLHTLVAFYRSKKIPVDWNYIFENTKPKNLESELATAKTEIQQLRKMVKDKDEIIRLLKENNA